MAAAAAAAAEAAVSPEDGRARARVLALLEGADGSGPSAWVVYVGARWDPRFAAGATTATALRNSSNSSGSGSGSGSGRKLAYVSNDVDDAAAAEAAGSVGVCDALLRGDEGVEVMRLLGVATVPTVALVDAAAVERVGVPGVHDEEKEKEGESAIAPAELFAEGLRRHEAGEWAAALGAFARVLCVEPGHAAAAFNMAALLHMLGQPRLAVHYTAVALEARPDDLAAHVLLGTVLAAAERDAVVDAYRRLVQALEPRGQHHRSAHRLAVLTGEGPSAETADREYVRQVFDAMADSFEAKLVGHLKYRVPWQLFDAVSALRPPGQEARPWRILDLGCGSGLCGKLFRPYCTTLSDEETAPEEPAAGAAAMIGVDVAPKMVALALETGAYTEARVQDAGEALEGEEPGSLDLVLSADTFIYVGRLDACFAGAARALRRRGGAEEGGLFAFSIEELKEESGTAASSPGFRLVESGRYAQTAAYVEGLCREHGFRVRHREAVVVRTEQTAPIPGLIYVAERVEE